MIFKIDGRWVATPAIQCQAEQVGSPMGGLMTLHGGELFCGFTANHACDQGRTINDLSRSEEYWRTIPGIDDTELMATNRDLCLYLFDRTRHLTLQNIADLCRTPKEHVEAFYGQLKEAGLLRMWTTEGYSKKAALNGWSKYIDMAPTVETLSELLAKASAVGIDLEAELPERD